MTDTMHQDAVEAAARAIHERGEEALPARTRLPWAQASAPVRSARLADAQAAIAAYLAHRAEAGWRMMPREPTREMVKAAGAQAMKINPAEDDDWRAVAFDSLSIYRAMFDANAAAGGGDG